MTPHPNAMPSVITRFGGGLHGKGAAAPIVAPTNSQWRVPSSDNDAKGGSVHCEAPTLLPDGQQLPPAGPTSLTLPDGGVGAFLDGLEAITNAAIGLVVSLLLTWLWLGFTPVQSIGITAVFFFVSTARSYLIRRAFRWVS